MLCRTFAAVSVSIGQFRRERRWGRGSNSEPWTWSGPNSRPHLGGVWHATVDDRTAADCGGPVDEQRSGSAGQVPCAAEAAGEICRAPRRMRLMSRNPRERVLQTIRGEPRIVSPPRRSCSIGGGGRRGCICASTTPGRSRWSRPAGPARAGRPGCHLRRIRQLLHRRRLRLPNDAQRRRTARPGKTGGRTLADVF